MRAAVAATLALGLLSACGGTPHAATPGRGTTPLPQPYTWVRDVSPALALGGGRTATLSAVVAPAAPGDPWLIAGTAFAADGATTATVWTSQEGLRWTAHPLAGVDGQALAATSEGTRTVVVGSVGEGAHRRAEVWVSPAEGRLPVPVAFQASLSPQASGGGSAGAAMDLVAAGTVGLVAAGSVDGVAAVWYSSAGTTWTQEPQAGRLIAGRHGTLTSLLVYPAGILAAGTVADGTQVGSEVWASTDGIHWGAAGGSAFGPPGDHEVTGLAWTGKELVAVGAVRTSTAWRPAAWVSPGGGAWSQPFEAFAEEYAGQDGSALRAVATDPSGHLLAVGGPTDSPAAWTSTDGETWSPVALPASAGATAQLVATDGTTAVIADGQPGQPLVFVQAAGAWRTVAVAPRRATAEPVGFAHLGGRAFLAVDVDVPGAPRAAILGSTPSGGWQVTATLPGARLAALSAGASGLVAVGTTAAAAEAWTSPDAEHWREAPPLGPVGAGAAATAVAVLGPQVAVTGTQPLDGRPGAPPTASAWMGTATGFASTGPLSGSPTVGASWPVGACHVPGEVVAVGGSTRSGPPPTTRHQAKPAVPVAGSSPGPAGQQDDGTEAAAWSTTTGTAWVRAAVTPTPGVGAREEMDGCLALPAPPARTGVASATPSTSVAAGYQLVAYGGTTAPSGAEVPALWTSTDGGRTWALSSLKGVSGLGIAPWSSVAARRSRWLAAGGTDPASGALPTDPLWSSDDPIGPPVDTTATTGPDGQAALWLSTDAGAAWERLATTGPAWAGSQVAAALVTWQGTHPIVAGVVDGRLTVWAGTPRR